MDGKDCPVKEYGDALTARIEQIKNKLASEGCSESEIKTELEGLRQIQWSLKVNYTYAYNACDQAGTVGILELKPTAHKAMKKMMNLFITENSQDPTTLGASSDEYGKFKISVYSSGHIGKVLIVIILRNRIASVIGSRSLKEKS
jgi:hypothetical protein